MVCIIWRISASQSPRLSDEAPSLPSSFLEDDLAAYAVTDSNPDCRGKGQGAVHTLLVVPFRRLVLGQLACPLLWLPVGEAASRGSRDMYAVLLRCLHDLDALPPASDDGK
ncbi:hypothetical protein MGYG_04832 [Nannizzia gypsea CBS 118893]|uniref:Uncharacterized protein n=1 Tax=Arthroderma gypseum (strain ATCC MYA-4604 / CBS 118893) TaxID=535722 RepID=E4UX33_ARTGP|nr:hypothetical protein MGYG_04832 [Nannizzia gypsea CBS 118893]EFR01833.1 hypothetical protein MGYG_04832 [Nannizzia gypsea CBS 118893]